MVLISVIVFLCYKFVHMYIHPNEVVMFCGTTSGDQPIAALDLFVLFLAVLVLLVELCLEQVRRAIVVLRQESRRCCQLVR